MKHLGSLIMFGGLSLAFGLAGCAQTKGLTSSLDKSFNSLTAYVKKAEEGNSANRGYVTVENTDIIGFRNIKWGSKPSEDMVFIGYAPSTNKSVEVYKRRSDKLAIGNARLRYIHYYFFNGRFFKASTLTVGHADSDALLHAMETKYGTPVMPDQAAADPLTATYKLEHNPVAMRYAISNGTYHWRANTGYASLICADPARPHLGKEGACEARWASWQLRAALAKYMQKQAKAAGADM